ncbi:hypothetical protein [Psychrobacter sp. AOP7-B1-24]|uniref:hypothetical protein n=1 Tax=Psychrobacter sp. AOP7-B1-24 TaxID=3457645 RepID=UPI00402B8459
MSQTFSQITLHLLSGRIIDRVTEPAMMNWLSEEDNFASIQNYLSKLNRQVLMTSDQEGAYLGYLDINEKDSNKAIRQSFNKMSVLLYPLVLWLRLVRGATDSSRPLQAGDMIKLSDLLASIESSKQLELQLADIIAKIGRQTKEAKKQLNSLIEYLENEGYLHSVSSTGALYKATAKWSLLYDQLEYIGKYQNLHNHEAEYSRHQDTYQNNFDLRSAASDEETATDLAINNSEIESQHGKF